MIRKLDTVQSHTMESADQWDQLWRTDGRLSPTGQYDCLHRMADAFYSKPPICLSVQESGRPAIALPLISRRRWGGIRGMELPNNPWVQAGGLMVDRDIVTSDCFDAMVERIMQMNVSYVGLNWVTDSIDIYRLVDAFRQRGCFVDQAKMFDSGIIPVSFNWNQFVSSLSKGFRKKIRSNLRKLAEMGEVRFERICHFDDTESSDELIGEAFRLEHSGWKGREGTSLVANPKIARTFADLLHEIASRGQLELQFLTVGGRRIAVDIGSRSHGVHYSYKVGYEESYSRYSPGQVLTWLQLQHWHETRDATHIDTVGDINQATARWPVQTRSWNRYLVATGGTAANLLMKSATRLKSGFGKLKLTYG